jgi:multisubunit Na+/H+ antiporter MnhE subunit
MGRRVTPLHRLLRQRSPNMMFLNLMCAMIPRHLLTDVKYVYIGIYCLIHAEIKVDSRRATRNAGLRHSGAVSLSVPSAPCVH